MNTLIAFDLDDTLYREWDYVRSGYRAVAARLAAATGASAAELEAIITANRPKGFEAALDAVAARPGAEAFTVESMVECYRAHRPDIDLLPGVGSVLDELKRRGADLALITDGSTRHQRAKIEALGLYNIFAPEAVLISEETGGDKHTDVPWTTAEELFATPGRRFIYVGDNMAKDFRLPRQRGWLTVMLLGSAGNVFTQNPLDYPALNRPDITVGNLADILTLPQLKN